MPALARVVATTPLGRARVEGDARKGGRDPGEDAAPAKLAI